MRREILLGVMMVLCIGLFSTLSGEGLNYQDREGKTPFPGAPNGFSRMIDTSHL